VIQSEKCIIYVALLRFSSFFHSIRSRRKAKRQQGHWAPLAPEMFTQREPFVTGNVFLVETPIGWGFYQEKERFSSSSWVYRWGIERKPNYDDLVACMLRI
jgi:hypothetical protein